MTEGFVQLPPGWQETVDRGTGKLYYFNRATGQTQWERPGASDGSTTGAVQQSTANPQPLPDFEPAAQFEGARSGYVFQMGPSGLGYYKDVPLAVKQHQRGFMRGSSSLTTY